MKIITLCYLNPCDAWSTDKFSVLQTMSSYICISLQNVYDHPDKFTEMQHFALALVEPHEGLMGLPVQVPLDGVSSLRHVSGTTHLGVICKLSEDALSPAVSLMKILNSAGNSMDS